MFNLYALKIYFFSEYHGSFGRSCLTSYAMTKHSTIQGNVGLCVRKEENGRGLHISLKSLKSYRLTPRISVVSNQATEIEPNQISEVNRKEGKMKTYKAFLKCFANYA